MNVEIHIHNIKSQLVPLLPDGSRTRFPKRETSTGREVEHPIINALDHELRYEIETLINRQLRKVPVRRFSTKTYKFDTGCLSYVTKVLKTFQQPYTLVDKRVPTPPGEVIPIRDEVKIREYQEAATNAALKCQRGVLRLATGAGKTFIAWNVLRQLNLPTVIFVHTIDLLDQFKEAGEFLLNIPVGKVGNGEVDIQQFTVVMMQSCIKAFDQKYVAYEIDPEGDGDEKVAYSMEQKAKIRNLIEGAGAIVADECFIEGTFVLREDGVPIPIEQMSRQKVLTCSSKKQFASQSIANPFKTRQSSYVKIRLAEAVHVTTQDHKWMIYDPAPLDVRSLKREKAKNLKIGDALLSVRSLPHFCRNDKSSQELRFLALILCDGHFCQNANVLKVEVSKDVDYFREEFASCKGIAPVFVKEGKSERSLLYPNQQNTTIFSVCDKALAEWAEGYIPKGKKSTIVEIPEDVFLAPLSAVASFLRTVFDCEGTISSGSVRIGMRSQRFIKQLQLLLLKFGIISSYKEREPSTTKNYGRETGTIYQLLISLVESLRFFSKKVGFSIERKQKALEALCLNRKEREVMLGHAAALRYVAALGIPVYRLAKQYGIHLRYKAKKDRVERALIQKLVSFGQEYEKKLPEEQRSKAEELREQLLWLLQWRFSFIQEKEIVKSDLAAYDFTVPETHTFYAQGQLTSNCHHLSCKTLQTLFKNAKNAFYRFGLTATMREDGADLLIYGVTGRVLYDVTASFLIEHNPPYLVRPTIYYLKVKRPKGSSGNYQSRYKSDIVEYEHRNELAVQSAMRLVKRGHRVLVLARQIKHLKLMRDMMADGFKSEWEDIKDMDSSQIKFELATGSVNKKERKRIIDEMRRGNLECLFASTIADEGLDCPPISAVILAGGGKSATKSFQRVGRALRLYEGKDKAVIIDFYDQGKYFKKHAERRMELFKKEPAFKLKIQK